MKKTIEKEFLCVKEVSNKYNISEHTLRYYTDAGLIPTVKRDKNNSRIFNKDSLNWLSLVICFRNCGMSIESIKEYERLCLIGDSTLQDRYKIILDQKKEAQEAFEQAKITLDFMNNKVKYYEDIINGKKEDTTNPYNW